MPKVFGPIYVKPTPSPEQRRAEAKAIIDQYFGADREQTLAMTRQNAPNIDRATREVKTDRELLNHLDRVRAYRDQQIAALVKWLNEHADLVGKYYGELRAYGEARIKNVEDMQRKVAIHMAWQRQRSAVNLGGNK